MGASIYRKSRGLVVWEDERCVLGFELGGDGREAVGAEDLVDMEGDLDVAALEPTLERAVSEINAWLGNN